LDVIVLRETDPQATIWELLLSEVASLDISRSLAA
jgi:hypothetical protein